MRRWALVIKEDDTLMQNAHLPLADIAVLVTYLACVTLLGCCFVRGSRTAREFTSAGGSLPGWAVGLSILGTYLSSNTFLGVPGKAYATNWNAFVFSLSIPLAAWLAVKYFVPFYRDGGEISAYTHLEKRFGPWARVYAVSCYLLTQIARIGTVMFGTALGLHALTGWSLETIILVNGVIVTLYTLLGGIRAVVWTDAVQCLVLVGGAVVMVVTVLAGMPDGPSQAISIAREHGKFSLGNFSLSVTTSTFWIVLFYGLFTNLNNFGIDQNYVQRYHLAATQRAAARSVWLGSLLYIPLSMLFFFLGSCLFSYYHAQPEMLSSLRARAVSNVSSPGEQSRNSPTASMPETDAQLADRVLPDFISRKLRGGLAGLVIAAIFAAAMSTLDSSINSSATVFLRDVYQRYIRPGSDERHAMRVLHGFTIFWGAVGTGAAIAMIGIASILDTWWLLSGIFAGAMLGLFLLGMVCPRANGACAMAGVAAGLLVIVWMTLSPGSRIPEAMQSRLHPHLAIVAGTLTILGVGAAASRFVRQRR